MESIERLMDGLDQYFLPDKAAGVEAVLLFKFSAPQPLSWVIRIGGDQCRVERGEVENPTITLTADPAMYYQILTGKYIASMAVSRGKIRLSGDLSLANRVATFFKLPNGMRLSLL